MFMVSAQIPVFFYLFCSWSLGLLLYEMVTLGEFAVRFFGTIQVDCIYLAYND